MSIIRKQLAEVQRVIDDGERDKLEAIKAFNEAAAKQFQGVKLMSTPKLTDPLGRKE